EPAALQPRDPPVPRAVRNLGERDAFALGRRQRRDGGGALPLVPSLLRHRGRALRVAALRRLRAPALLCARGPLVRHGRPPLPSLLSPLSRRDGAPGLADRADTWSGECGRGVHALHGDPRPSRPARRRRLPPAEPAPRPRSLRGWAAAGAGSLRALDRSAGG